MIRIILMLVSGLSLMSGLLGQDAEAEQILETYYKVKEASDYERGVELLKEGLSKLNDKSPDTLRGKFYDHLTQCYFWMGKKQEALASERRALTLYKSGYGLHEATAFATNNLAYLLKTVDAKTDSAIYHYQECLAIYEALDMPLDEAETLRSIGLSYYGLGDYFAATDYYRKAVSILEKLPDERPKLFAEHLERSVRTQSWCYLNLAQIHFDLGDKQQIRNYLLRSQDLLDRFKDKDPVLALESIENKARLYGYLSEYDKSIATYKELLEEYDPDRNRGHTNRILMRIAEVYGNPAVADYKKAVAAWREVLSHDQQYPSRSKQALIQIYKELAACHLKQQQFAETDAALTKALGLNEEVKNALRASDLANLQAISAYMQGQHEDAIAKVDLALESYEFSPSAKLSRLESLRSMILFEQFQEEADPDLLEQSEVWARRSMATIKKHEERIFHRRSFGQNYRRPSSCLLEILVEKYQETGDEPLEQEIFSLMEANRGRSLKLGINWENQLFANRYSQNWLNSYQNLQRKRLAWANERYELERKKGPEDRLFALSDSLVQVEEAINEMFSDRRVNQRLGSYEQDLNGLTRSLDRQTAILEYFMGDSSLFVMAIHQNGVLVHRTSLSPSLRSLIDDLALLVRRPDSDAKLLGGKLYACYQRILEPALDQLPRSIDRLFIVPDDQIVKIPWAALCTTEISNTDFRSWPYLIKKYQLAFLPFASDLMHWQKRQEESLACVAPSYPENPVLDDQKELITLRRDGFWKLPGAEKEIEEIADIYGKGAQVFKNQFSKEDFLAMAPNYGNLHLSMHALSNIQDPSQSYLLFPADSINDGRLTALELLNLGLQTDLMVLSACYGGDGPWQAGEGVQSIANIMRQSGVQSVLSNSWAAADQFSGGLMRLFYQNLEQGASLDKALAGAQKKYLLEAKPLHSAHPFYWAGWQLEGNMLPIAKNAKAWYWWIILAGLILLGTYYGWRRIHG